jgi:hypothetical protein
MLCSVFLPFISLSFSALRLGICFDCHTAFLGPFVEWEWRRKNRNLFCHCRIPSCEIFTMMDNSNRRNNLKDCNNLNLRDECPGKFSFMHSEIWFSAHGVQSLLKSKIYVPATRRGDRERKRNLKSYNKALIVLFIYFMFLSSFYFRFQNKNKKQRPSEEIQHERRRVERNWTSWKLWNERMNFQLNMCPKALKWH